MTETFLDAWLIALLIFFVAARQLKNAIDGDGCLVAANYILAAIWSIIFVGFCLEQWS